MRAWSEQSSSELATTYAKLFETGMCFTRLEFGLGGVSPAAIAASAVAHARQWRLTALRHATRFLPGRPPPFTRGSVLYIMRKEERAIANDRELYDAMTARIRTPIRRVWMERHTLSEQMHLVGSASVLFAAHGMALTFAMFLPDTTTRADGTAERAAMIELQPSGLGSVRYCYSNMMTKRGVRVVQYIGRLAGRVLSKKRCISMDQAKTVGCCSSAVPLMCNISVDAEQVAKCAHEAVAWTMDASKPPHLGASTFPRSERCETLVEGRR